MGIFKERQSGDEACLEGKIELSKKKFFVPLDTGSDELAWVNEIFSRYENVYEIFCTQKYNKLLKKGSRYQKLRPSSFVSIS